MERNFGNKQLTPRNIHGDRRRHLQLHPLKPYNLSYRSWSELAGLQRRSERNEGWRCSAVRPTEQAYTATKPHAYLFLSTAQAPNISINTSVYSTIQPQCTNKGRNKAGVSSLRAANSLQATLITNVIPVLLYNVARQRPADYYYYHNYIIIIEFLTSQV
jgi:hypothetical protein